MLKGHNSDLNVRGKLYHIQTEDWGQSNPFVVSRVFCNGAVLKTIKTPYAEILKKGSIYSEEALKQGLAAQHNQIMDALISGSFV